MKFILYQILPSSYPGIYGNKRTLFQGSRKKNKSSFFSGPATKPLPPPPPPPQPPQEQNSSLRSPTNSQIFNQYTSSVSVGLCLNCNRFQFNINSQKIIIEKCRKSNLLTRPAVKRTLLPLRSQKPSLLTILSHPLHLHRYILLF